MEPVEDIGQGAGPAAIRYVIQADSSPAVGDVLPLTGARNPGSDHVVVVAGLVDGSRQVVLDVVV